jgi:hypothetical protein
MILVFKRRIAIYALEGMTTMLCRLFSSTALPILYAQLLMLVSLTSSSFEELYSTD